MAHYYFVHDFNPPSKLSDRDPSNVTVIILSYVKNLSKSFRRMLPHLNMKTCLKPHIILRQIPVHPKTKSPEHQKNEVVYGIPYGTCDKAYVYRTAWEDTGA